MNFLTMALSFILGLIFLISGSHIKSNVVAKMFYVVGAFSVVLAMYTAWPK